MVEDFQIRTDLALEMRERYTEEDVRIRGVRIEKEDDALREIYTTIIHIDTENGAKAMRRPVGNYITLEAPNMAAPDEGVHREIAEVLAKHLRKLMQGPGSSVLVVGLGNREVTPDALGPAVVNNLNISRHIAKEFGRISTEETGRWIVSAIVPGVMAQTGMETLEIIRGVVKETEPDMVIAVDALAARSTRRLNRTIQITDTGINPGSGVGNHRNGINKEALGIPVIAIGVPTVVDAATIVNDSMEELLRELDMENEDDTEAEEPEAFGNGALMYSAEHHIKIRERISPQLNTMFVTPKDIDETMKMLSCIISEGINLALTEKTQGKANRSV